MKSPSCKRKIAYFFCFVMSCFLCVSGKADLLTTWKQTVFVDLQAENALIAKNKAIAEAQTQALTQLAERLCPSISANALSQLLTIAPEDCLKGYEIHQEKMSGVRYYAKFVWDIDLPRFLSLLNQQNIPYNLEALEGPTLVLSATEARPEDPLKVFDQVDTPWKEAVETIAAKDSTRWILPLGDLTDLTLLPSLYLSSLQAESFTKLLAHYEVKSLLLCCLSTTQTNQPQSITLYKITPPKIEKIKSFFVKESMETPSLETDYLAAAQQALEEKPLMEKTPVETLFDTPAQPLAPHPFVLKIHYASLEDWVKVSKLIKQIPAHSLTLVSMTTKEAHVTLKTSWDMEALTRWVEHVGLKSVRESESLLHIGTVL